MFRRFLVKLCRRSLFVLLVICLGCSAQSAPPDVTQRIEHQVRSFYNVPPDVKVTIGPLHSSEFPNYDGLKISFDNGEKHSSYDFLLSKDRNTLIRMTRFDLTKDPYLELMKKIDVNGRPVRGDKDAKVVAVSYDDFECPFCSHMHQTLFPELLKEYGDRVKFVYKDFPLAEIHPWATHAAVDANCLAAQNSGAYWDFADYIHANQRDVSGQKGREEQFAELDRLTLLQGQKHELDGAKLQSCIKAQNDDAVKASVKEAEALGVDATPTMFINGQKVDGAVSAADLRTILDRALEQAGVPAPVHAAAGGQPAGK
jgi:protein-disulfide isomerase